MKRRELLTNLAVVVVAGVAGLALCELGIRVVVDPSDYLSVEMVHDDILGAVPQGSAAGGFDAWGFRNARVPDSATIVAIGDSHTYGNTAAMSDAWPAVLAGLTGQPVYNMGLGGYGPNQYRHLLETKAFELDPRLILVGLYIGDDFENAFLITHGLDYWNRLRSQPAEHVEFDIWQEPSAPSWHRRIRIWLSRNSVVYQLVFHGPLLGRLKGEAQIRTAAADTVTTLSIPERNILEAFRPGSMLRVLDQRDPRILEGMRITFELLDEMHDLSSERGVDFAVVLIPTKELVFAEHLEHRSDLALSGVIDELLTNERQARDKTIAFLDSAGVGYVDALPFLRQAIDGELYVKSASDMHPNGNGYHVIADAVFDALSQGGSLQQAAGLSPAGSGSSRP